MPGSIRTNPDIARLFPNYVELEKEYYKRTKIYPDHASGRDPQAGLRKVSVRRDQPLQRLLRAKEIALKKCSTCAHCAT